MDYATKFSITKLVPLRNTKAPTLAKELLRIFLRVGFSQEVVIDQGTNFMSRVMTNLWKQLGVHPLKTSVYHPQTNGLVERFNQSLKKMLKKYVAENPKPRWVEAVFAAWEIPQASTGFSPFKFLGGRKPRGILDLARRQWGGEENQNTGKGPTDLGQLRKRLKQISQWARENLRETQKGQKAKNDKKVRVRSFCPGDQVLPLPFTLSWW